MPQPQGWSVSLARWVPQVGCGAVSHHDKRPSHLGHGPGETIHA